MRALPSSRRCAPLLLWAALATGTATGPAPCARADGVDAVEASYRASLKRPSLYKRMQGRVLLARTGELRALGMLVDDYVKAEEPKDVVRALIATLAAENLAGQAEMRGVWARWRERAREPGDAWLWYRSMPVDRVLGGDAAVVAAKDAALPTALRAAALRALGSMSDPDAPGVVAAVLDALPTAEPARGALLEACAASATGWSAALKDEATRAVVERIARTLDDAALSVDTKDVVARALARLFGTDTLGPGAAPWLRELSAAAVREDGAERPEVQYAPGPFFGLRATGRRVVYVIDASDSMLEPLKEDELKKLRVVTPSDDRPADPKKPKKDLPEPLPWQRIKNRFDAAREVLKLAVRSLPPDKFVCVVLFGDDAKPLVATPHLVPADPKTVAAVAAELDRIKPSPAPGDKARPYGSLRGATNLHGGLRLAFRVTTAGKLGPGEYVDLSRTGCDAVYLLSDGNPTTDDFRKVDKRDEEQAVKDRESMTPIAPPPELTFQGPYGARTFENFDFLTDDVRRLNLLRQAEIHCVALGDVDDSLLAGLAEIGGGQFRRLGD